MIPGHLPQASRKPRGVPIPDTQFSFGGEKDGDGDEEGNLPFASFSFVSILISQASSSMWLEEQEDMMLSLINLTRSSKKREQRIFSAIRWLTGSGSIYRFFYLGGQAYRRKTESGRCPRWAQPTWAR